MRERLTSSGIVLESERGAGIALSTGSSGQTLVHDGVGGFVPNAGPSSVDAAPTVSGTCLAGTAVGEAVYISASNVFTPARANSTTTMPCVGIIASKPTSTTCQVQAVGPITLAGPLTPGLTYYVDPASAGGITSTPPSTAGQVVQPLGVAKTSTILDLNVGPSEVVL